MVSFTNGQEESQQNELTDKHKSPKQSIENESNEIKVIEIEDEYNSCNIVPQRDNFKIAPHMLANQESDFNISSPQKFDLMMYNHQGNWME